MTTTDSKPFVCKRGHVDDVYLDRQGRRSCRACRKVAADRHRLALRDTPCGFLGCSHASFAKGFCHGHWRQQWQGRTLAPLVAVNRIVDGMKRCCICEEVKPVAAFGKKLAYTTEHCRDCRGVKLRSELYGLEFDAVREMLASPTCGCCGAVFLSRRDQQIDHCHTTNKVRGLLCQKCNTALGCVNDDVDVLRGLIAYLERSR